MLSCVLVIPCYNEAHRLPCDTFEAFLRAHPDTGCCFVDDGSTDDTATLLHRLAQRLPEQCAVLSLGENQGKGEAVRQGLLYALEHLPAESMGFWDADLATPLDTSLRMRTYLCENPEVHWVLGSRVRLLGRSIHRTWPRHYAARFFATVVSLTVRLEVYDSQCGAKLFRRTDGLADLLAEPFLSRWIFDVELLARYKQYLSKEGIPFETRVHEFPLTSWADVKGSRLVPSDFMKAGLDLARIYRQYR